MKSPPLILIVDDNPANVYFRVRFAAHKYEILTAMDGEAVSGWPGSICRT